MSDARLIAANTRVMFTDPTLASTTQYPTGVPLGLKGGVPAATTGIWGGSTTTADNNTTTTTEASSVFHNAPNKACVIRRIICLVAGTGATPTFKLANQLAAQSKDLTPTFTPVAGQVYDFGEGFVVQGGFRVVMAAGTTQPVMMIVYEMIPAP